jgi:hypothetical protein
MSGFPKGGSGSGGGGLLADVQYAPSVLASPSNAGGIAAVDATHLTISFKAPTSGNVLVRLTANQYTPAGGYAYWALLDHTAHTQVGDSVAVCGGVEVVSVTSAVFLITGLTANTTYQYDWAFLGNGVTTTMYIQGATGIPGQPNAGPAVMEVWSA